MKISSRDVHAAIAVGSGFLLFGTVAGLFAFFLFRRSFRKVRHWKTASGTIVGYKVSGFQTGRPDYIPEFQFAADNGKEITGVADVGSNRQRFRIGARVKVLYFPDDPTKAQLRTFTDLWLPPIVLGFFGLAFLGVGVFLLIHLIIDCLAK